MAQIDELFQAAVGPYRALAGRAHRLRRHRPPSGPVPRRSQRGPLPLPCGGPARLPGPRHRAQDLTAPGLLPAPRLPAGCRRAAADALRCLLARLTSAAQPSSTASMARMNRCSAWSTAITPTRWLRTQGCRAHERAHWPAPVDDGMGDGGGSQGCERLPRWPAVAQDGDEQQQAHEEVVAGHVGGQGGPGAGLGGRLPVGLSDPVAKQVAGEQDEEHGRRHRLPRRSGVCGWTDEGPALSQRRARSWDQNRITQITMDELLGRFGGSTLPEPP